MSNRPKGVKMHPANKLSDKEIRYNTFIRCMIRLAKHSGHYGKHVGSKCMRVLKLRTTN